ncbi:hypothetical protein PV729_26470 [Streptomyces europaeiscabiei]|uniref:Integral membrane protein n=1 Tax=Streptomyces europaeiscabiei TaxID=146819 RepID=A0ABU4NRF3_9ACTN|nr:hypothetical protein [Streptomyces europaeiscabiei]MDX3555267.1 hypothetical protein [Streptomyces europaeiscabiei]MDX3705281.1 hypothetical protein [Streptomyces europaeiscabiei]
MGPITLFFTKDEVDDLSDGAAAVAIAGAMIPDPGVSKGVAACAGITALVAKRAKRKGTGLLLIWLHGLFGVPTGVPIFRCTNSPGLKK